MFGAKESVILLGVVSLSLAALSPSQEVEVMRCAKAGLVFHPETEACYPPLSPGPCEEGEMVVLDSESLLGRCVERRCEGDLVWDQGEARCVEMFGREVSQGGQC